MTEPEFIVQAKAKVEAEFDKSTLGVRQYVQTFMTSRISMALALAFFMTFACTAFYAPDRIAPLSSLNLVQYGLMGAGPTLDLSDFNVSAADQQQKVSDFTAQALPRVAQAYAYAKSQFPALPLGINIAGAVLSLGALIYTVRLQIRAARNATRSPAL